MAYETHRGPGRPLDPAVGGALLDAVVELVSERGYDGTTLEAIAARAGASKPAIYRRWPGGKQELVAAAVAAIRADVATHVDTGSLRGDLVALTRQFIEGVQRHAHLAAGLTQRLRESPELARVYRETVLAEDRARFMEIVERAVERGELPTLPMSAALSADVGPALSLFRGLVSDDVAGEGLAEQVVDLVILPALGAGPNMTKGTA